MVFLPKSYLDFYIKIRRKWGFSSQIHFLQIWVENIALLLRYFLQIWSDYLIQTLGPMPCILACNSQKRLTLCVEGPGDPSPTPILFRFAF